LVSGLVGAPVRVLLVLCWLSIAVGLPGEAPWGNAWSDASGAVALAFEPLAVYYTCTVRTQTYSSMAECSAVCEAGVCALRREMATVPSIEMQNTSSGAATFVSTFSSGIILGQNLNFTVKGATTGMQIRVKEDPGLPVGMSYKSLPDGLLLDWVPRDTQHGYVHELELAATLGGQEAAPWRIRVPVVPPAVAFDLPRDLTGEHALVAVPGSPTTLELRCHSNYPAWMMLAPGHEKLPLGLMVRDVSDGRREYVDGALGPYPGATKALTYTPPRGSEGSEATVCFDCGAVQATARRCVSFKVDLCRYTASEGDTLTSVSRGVYMQPNWRRLWNLNPGLEAGPESTLAAGTVINVGPVYRVLPGDTLDLIAGRFHTTTKGILSLNPQLTAESPGDGVKPLMAGSPICLPTCTSEPTPSQDYIHPY